jgi:hypothetical protein
MTDEATFRRPVKAELLTTAAAFDYSNLEFHPVANEWDMLSDDDLELLGESIKDQGILVPIALLMVNNVPYILDGRNRYTAAKRVGHKFVDKNFTLLPANTDPEAYVYTANAQRRQMTDEEKEALIIRKLRANPDMSDRAIARLVRVDPKTVGKKRKKIAEELTAFTATWDGLPPRSQLAFVNTRREVLSRLLDRALPGGSTNNPV